MRLAIAVFMPISRCCVSNSGPPELPGLIAASIWMIERIIRRLRLGIERLRLEMMPVVSVRSRPNGLPMAYTRCPTRSPLESPITTGSSRFAGASIFNTAVSLVGSTPTSAAS